MRYEADWQPQDCLMAFSTVLILKSRQLMGYPLKIIEIANLLIDDPGASKAVQRLPDVRFRGLYAV